MVTEAHETCSLQDQQQGGGKNRERLGRAIRMMDDPFVKTIRLRLHLLVAGAEGGTAVEPGQARSKNRPVVGDRSGGRS
jgi:hypothetical protein